MAERILGPEGGRRRRRFLFVPIVAIVALALFFIASAQGVHDTGAFQLDGDAATATSPPGITTNGVDDWDRVCHQVLGLDCSTTSNTTGAIAVSFTNDGAQNATIFTTGGSKDPSDLNNWQWKDQSGGLPDKDNLQDSFAARYSLAPSSTCPVLSPATTCEVLYFGSDRFDNSGDAQQGFWFFQKKVVLATTGPNTGKFVDDQGNLAVHTIGDILVVSDFSNGGTTSFITVYEWVGSGGDQGSLQTLGGGANKKCGLAHLTTSAGSSTRPTAPLAVAVPRQERQQHLPQGEFFEGGVNLSTSRRRLRASASPASSPRHGLPRRRRRR